MKKLYALISALIVALLFGGVATAAYASPIPVDPDKSAPSLVSAAMVSPTTVGAGDTISIDYVVREDVGLLYAAFAFESDSGARFEVTGHPDVESDGLSTGTARKVVDGSTWEGGVYRLAAVALLDRAGNETQVYDSGTLAELGLASITVAGTSPTPTSTPTSTTLPTAGPTTPATNQPEPSPESPAPTATPAGPTPEPISSPSWPTSTADAPAHSQSPTIGDSAPIPPGHTPEQELATTGVDSNGALALGVGSLVLLAGAAMLLLRRKPAGR